MSFDFNYKYWIAIKKDIQHLIRRQNELKNVEPIEDPLIIFHIVSQMYIIYADIVSKLSYIYTETFQVQKRAVLQNLIEPAIQRLIELKNKLKKIELSEYVYLDKSLIAQNLTPYDMLIWQLHNFIYRRPTETQNILFEYQPFQNKATKQKFIMQAITVIQSHEKARQARRYRSEFEYNPKNLKINIDRCVTYTFNPRKDQFLLIPVKRTIFNTNFIKSVDKCQNILETEVLQETQNDGVHYTIEKMEKTALRIQKAWKSYKARKTFKFNKNKRHLLYGLRKAKKLLYPERYEQNIFKIYQNNLKQKEFDKSYVQLMTDERTRLFQEHQPQIMEDISDHIRSWFKEFYDQTGDFHPFPDAVKSGTVQVLLDETMNLEEFKEYKNNQGLSKEQKKMLKEKQKIQEKKEKEKIKKDKLKEKKRQKKMSDAGICDIGYELKTNENVEKLEKIFSQFLIDWKSIDEYLNKQHNAIKEWITENELATIHKELRSLVDEYMRIEYNLLKESWCVDNKQKYKAPEKQKLKNTNKTKIKTTIDLTANRTNESLYQELRAAEIIENYQNKSFDDYLGDFNLMADDCRNDKHFITLDPAKADIKMVIQDSMFGMGKFNVDKPKSLCLIGPENSGKKLLCNIVASEIGAIILNLSPEKTYQFSENLKYFIHIVMKVAKVFQPTIIYIQDAHRIFWKSIPKDQMAIKPTLLKSVLVKNILKAIQADDKIMVVGTSSLPWSANATFKKVFQNILLIPNSDYGSIFLLWLDLITQNVCSNYFEDFIFSVLAKVFHRYSTGDITSVSNMLNVERRLRLHSNKLNPNEFLEYFISRPNPIFSPDEKVYEKYKNWYNKLKKFGNTKSPDARKKK